MHTSASACTRRTSRTRFSARITALICTGALLFGLGAGSAAAQSSFDSTVVTVTNSYIDQGSAEQIFDGPLAAAVTNSDEFVGFGGFNIDVSETAIFMAWSSDPAFDDFEGEFDATFTDIFTFEFDGYEVVSASANAGENLVPAVSITGANRVSVSFGNGLVYADGQRAVIQLELKPAPSTTFDNGGAVVSTAATDVGRFGGLGVSGNVDTELSSDLNRWVAPDIRPSAAAQAAIDAAATPAADDGASLGTGGSSDANILAVSGSQSDQIAALAIGGLCFGATLTIASRRRSRQRVRRLMCI